MGLALARQDVHDSRRGEVLSLYVQPEERRRGIAHQLLAAAEDALRGTGCEEVSLGYKADSPAAPALERLLAAAGWEPPRPFTFWAQFDRRLLESPWANKPLPERLTVFPWNELTPDEYARLSADPLSAHLFAPAATPDAEQELNYGVGVRAGDAVVGWVMAHPTGLQSAHYTHLYLQPEYRGGGAIFRLFSEAHRRQVAAMGLACTGTITLSMSNEALVRVFRRKFLTYCLAWSESCRSWKRLA